MAKKVHMYTKEKGLSCGCSRNLKDLVTTFDTSRVTCKSCLKKISSEKVWVGKKDIFSTGNILRVKKNLAGSWEVILYMNGYKVGHIRKRDGDILYTSKGRAYYAAGCFRDKMRYDRCKIIKN